MRSLKNGQAVCGRRLAAPRCRSPSLQSTLNPLYRWSRRVARRPVEYHRVTATLGNLHRKLAFEAHLLVLGSCRGHRGCTHLWLPSAQNTDTAHHAKTSESGSLRRPEELSAPVRQQSASLADFVLD